MILINDGYGVGITNLGIIYKRFKARSIKLRKIMDDEKATQERRDYAYEEFIGYQEESLRKVGDEFARCKTKTEKAYIPICLIYIHASSEDDKM